jgi:hypothetical protein
MLAEADTTYVFDGNHRGWYKKSNNPHHHHSTNPGKHKGNSKK